MKPHFQFFVTIIATTVCTLSLAQEKKQSPRNEKIEIYLLENKMISGVTGPKGMQLNESGKGPLSYAHAKPIFEFTKQKVAKCTMKKVGFGSLPGHGWLVNIKLTETAKAELISAMKTDAAKKAGWFIISLNGKKQPGEHTTGYLATGFNEIGIAYYRTKEKAEQICNALSVTTSNDSPKPSDESNVAKKLARMKPSVPHKIVEKAQTASILLYTVEPDLLDGKPAAICDIKNCRIAILGLDIAKTRDRVKSLNIRVSGAEKEEKAVKDTDGNPFFTSNYESKKAKCSFHTFEFDLTDRVLAFGPLKPAGYRSQGTLWSNASNVGVLILVDFKTGKFTTHAMRPKAKRVLLEEKTK